MIGTGLGARNEMVPLGQPAINVTPTHPSWLCPAWHPHALAHGPPSSCVTHKDGAYSAGSSLEQDAGMFLEATGITDLSSNQGCCVLTFPRAIASCCYFPSISPVYETVVVCLFFFPLHEGHGFQTDHLTICTSTSPYESLHHQRGAGGQKSGWQQNGEKNHNTFQPGDLHAPGRAHGKFPEHPSHRFTTQGRTRHKTNLLKCVFVMSTHLIERLFSGPCNQQFIYDVAEMWPWAHSHQVVPLHDFFASMGNEQHRLVK